MTASTLWRTTVPLTAVAFVCLLTSVPAAAQVSTSTIQGIVSDATGVLPGATVTAKEVSSGFTQETVSGSDGSFALAGLRPGHLRDHGRSRPVQASGEDRRNPGGADRHRQLPHHP